jgi:hypothetical protein
MHPVHYEAPDAIPALGAGARAGTTRKNETPGAVILIRYILSVAVFWRKRYRPVHRGDIG